VGNRFGYPAYPQKKQPEHYAANQVEGLSNDLVRLLALNRERDQIDIQGYGPIIKVSIQTHLL
jgi:hypothetical protein